MQESGQPDLRLNILAVSYTHLDVYKRQLVYIVLCVFFAYFYTSITFNPLEVADNIKKQGGFIPGIRPGKPTSDYLTKMLNYIIFILSLIHI